MFFKGLIKYVDDTWPGGLSGLGDWIGRERPTFITFNHNHVPKWMRRTINDHYVRAGSAPKWIWYVDRSVGHSLAKKFRQGDQHRWAVRRGDA